MSNPPTFVRASELYDFARDERIPIDWTRGQPLAESQAEIDDVVPEGR